MEPSRYEQPISLMPETIGADPVRRAPVPIPVRAWVPYPDLRHHAVEAHAIEWTRKAVRITWTDSWGDPQDAWVWAQAVTRETPDSPPPF